MTLEAILAYLHLAAILAMVVFITSEAALCRVEWLNASVVERLALLDRIYVASAVAVLLTGLARVQFGAKGSGFYWSHWLLWVKLAAFVAVALLSIRPTLAFLRWRRALRADGRLPAGDEVKRVRRQVMTQAHLIPLIPLAAVFLARGF